VLHITAFNIGIYRPGRRLSNVIIIYLQLFQLVYSTNGIILVYNASIFHIIIIIIIIVLSSLSLVTSLFFLLLLLLNQRRSPALRLQVSDCSTFCIMCDVPSIAVFCSESIECFPGMAFRTFFDSPAAIPVAPYYRYNRTFHVSHSTDRHT